MRMCSHKPCMEVWKPEEDDDHLPPSLATSFPRHRLSCSLGFSALARRIHKCILGILLSLLRSTGATGRQHFGSCVGTACLNSDPHVCVCAAHGAAQCVTHGAIAPAPAFGFQVMILTAMVLLKTWGSRPIQGRDPFF